MSPECHHLPKNMAMMRRMNPQIIRYQTGLVKLLTALKPRLSRRELRLAR